MCPFGTTRSAFRRRGRRWTDRRRSTCASSGPASPGSGPPTTSSRPTPRCGCSSSSSGSPATARAAATADGSSAASPGRAAATRQTHGRQAVIDLQHAMNATVDEVIAVAAARGHRRRHRQGRHPRGGVHARTARATAGLRRRRSTPWGETDHRLLSAEESMARINVANTLGGAYSPHGARIQPAKLVRGLSDVGRAARRHHRRADHGHRDPAAPRASPTAVTSPPTSCCVPPRGSPPASRG